MAMLTALAIEELDLFFYLILIIELAVFETKPRDSSDYISTVFKIFQ